MKEPINPFIFAPPPEGPGSWGGSRVVAYGGTLSQG